MELISIYPEHSKILLVGTYPPPLGGVSVHIKRLSRQLKTNGCEVNIFDVSKQNGSKITIFFRLLKLITITRFDIVHIHVPNLIMDSVLFLLKYLKRYKLYYSYHNPRIFLNINGFNGYFIRRFIRHLDYLILVSEQILVGIEKIQIKLPKNVLVENAFLPPSLEEENYIVAAYPNETKEFIKTHKPLIIANAFKILFYENVDLYGLDLCVELIHKLKQNFPKVGLLFALADESANVDYIILMKHKIKELGIQEQFNFMTGQKELWPLFKQADLSIRPTITDGDAISIREALYLNCPVIASDVAKRPEGTITFKSRDLDDLYLRVSEILYEI